jgi:chromosome transmission fidelity protein 8
MPSVPLHLTSKLPSTSLQSLKNPQNPLPTLIATPSGLAILEIQGTIHAPFPTPSSPSTSTTTSQNAVQTPIGRLEFPLYDASTATSGDTKWTKKVYLYVGQHQRLVGEVKKMGMPLGVLRRRDTTGDSAWGGAGQSDQEGLEVAEVVRWKIVFGGRAEPV